MTGFPPPQGRRPTLDWLTPGELAIDGSYQRSIETDASRKLIRNIAERWRWDLCLPLLVSRRPDGKHFVVDGQHRREAAVLRGDIPVLPCFVRELDGAAAEASLFIAANRARKTMSALDDYHAAVAAGDETASLIDGLVRGAGLAVAHHSMTKRIAAGELVSVAGIRTALRIHGREVVEAALTIVGEAFPDEVLVNSAALIGGVVRIFARLPAGVGRDAVFEALLEDTSAGWAQRANLPALTGGAQRERAIEQAVLAVVEQEKAA